MYHAQREHIPLEEWVYQGVLNQTVQDPMLVQFIRQAVEIREGFGWPRCR